MTITDRGKSMAIISPPVEKPIDLKVDAMLREGVAQWSGGKPRGSKRPARVKGSSMAHTVREGRR